MNETFVKLRPCFSHQNNSDRSAAKVVTVAIIKLISKLYIPSTVNILKKDVQLSHFGHKKGLVGGRLTSSKTPKS